MKRGMTAPISDTTNDYYLVQYLDHSNELSIVTSQDFLLQEGEKLPVVKKAANVKNPDFEKNPDEVDDDGRPVPESYSAVVRAISGSRPTLASWLETMRKTELFFVEDNNHPPVPSKRGRIQKELSDDELAENAESTLHKKIPKKKKKKEPVTISDDSETESIEIASKKIEKRKKDQAIDAIHSRIFSLQEADSIKAKETAEHVQLKAKVAELEDMVTKITKERDFYKDIATSSTILKDAKKILNLAKLRSSTPDSSSETRTQPSCYQPKSFSSSESLRSASTKLSVVSTSPSTSLNSLSVSSIPTESTSESNYSYEEMGIIEDIVDKAFPSSPSPSLSFEKDECHNSDESPSAETSSSQFKYNSSSKKVVEVMPNTGIYMSKVLSEELMVSKYGTITAAARKIVLDVFTSAALRVCTARGGPRPNSEESQCLNRKAMNAIIDKVTALGADKGWKPATSQMIIKSIGTKLTELRNAYKTSESLAGMQVQMEEKKTAITK